MHNIQKNHSSIGSFGQHKISPSKSDRKDAVLEQVMSGLGADKKTGNVPAQTYASRRFERRQASQQYTYVLQEKHSGLLRLFDHDNGPHAVNAQKQRVRDPEQLNTLALMKRWIQRSYCKKMVFVVVEFDNLARSISSHGISHYNCVTLRAKQLCIPVFNKYRATYISSNLETFEVIFDNPVQAVCAAYDVQHVLNAYRYGLDPSRAHLQCRLKGIGVDTGANIVIDTSGNVHGLCANAARGMAQVSGNGDILLSPQIVHSIQISPNFRSAKFLKREDLGCIELSGDLPYQSTCSPASDLRYLHPLCGPFAQRNQPGVDLDRLDSRILYQYGRNAAVLTYTVNMPIDDAREKGHEAALLHRLEIPQIVSKALQKHNAVSLSNDVYIFMSAMSAVKCAHDMKMLVEDWNRACVDPSNVRNIIAFGVHSSHCIIVPGTDIYWGSAFDVTHSICQNDFNGEVIVTADVYNDIAGDGVQAQSRAFDFYGVRSFGYAIRFAEKKKLTLEQSVLQKRVRFDESPAATPRPGVGFHGYDYPKLGSPGKRPAPIQKLISSPIRERSISSFGNIIKSEGEMIGTDWSGIVSEREQERRLSPEVQAHYRGARFPQSSPWVQNHLAQRQREEYDRSRNGFGSIGNPNDVILLHNSSRGKHMSDMTRFDENSVTNFRNRNTVNTIRPPPDTRGILNLGAQESPLKTRKLKLVNSHYDPVRQTYPAYTPYAPGAPNTEVTSGFKREMDERTGPIRIADSTLKTIDPMAGKAPEDSVKAHIHMYGQIEPEEFKQARMRSPRSQEMTEGGNIINLFKSYQDWSDDKQVDCGPKLRFDGSGREIVNREKPVYNRVLQRHMSDEEEALAKQHEIRTNLQDSKNKMERQIQHESGYNVITLADRRTGEIISSPRRDKGVRLCGVKQKQKFELV